MISESSKLPENTVILVTSDVHLGCDHIKFDEFNELIQDIATNRTTKYKSLQAIIFMGDLFDLLMCKYKRLGKKANYASLYDNFNKIDKIKPPIQMIYQLGNHECPVPEVDFPSNKKKIYKGIDGFLGSSVFDDSNTCQYVFLTSANGKTTLSLYDKRDQIPKKKNDITLKVSIDKIGKTLFCHGHQLLKTSTEMCTPIWFMLYDSPQPIKDFINEIWNLPNVFKEDGTYDLDKIKTEFAERQALSKLKADELKIAEDLLEKFVGNESHDQNPKILDEGMKKEITKFFDEEKNFKDFATVFFGHTHNYTQNFEIQTKENKTIYVHNTGAWQNVTDPTVIGITTAGDIDLYAIKDHEFQKLDYSYKE